VIQLLIPRASFHAGYTSGRSSPSVALGTLVYSCENGRRLAKVLLASRLILWPHGRSSPSAVSAGMQWRVKIWWRNVR